MPELETAFTRQVGIEVPLICGAMYPCSNPELIAAVSEAGGIGIIQPMSMRFVHKHKLGDGIRYIRRLTDKPVGFNAIVEKTNRVFEDQMRGWIDTALEAGLLKPEDVELINHGEAIAYQTGQLSREADFYSRYALLLTAIPLMPRQWVDRIQGSDRLIRFFGHLPLFLIPVIKIILNIRVNHGFLPLAIIKMEAFYTRRLIWLKLKRLFGSKRGTGQ